MTKNNLKKYFDELFPLSLEEAFNKLESYENKIKNNIDVIQMVFIKFFEHKNNQDLNKYVTKTNNYIYSWDKCENKLDLINFVNKYITKLMPYFQKIIKSGYYEFSEDLFSLRLVYIFVYLKEFKKIYKLQKILHDRAYNYLGYIFYDYFGNGEYLQPEDVQGYFKQGYYLTKKEFENAKLFDNNANLLDLGDNDEIK